MHARYELPELVRLLVTGSVRDLRTVEFRAGEGTGTSGWDGTVDAARGNAWVPEGQSGWEMGISEDILAKADKDYATRTKAPLGLDRSNTVFIFVTPRRWDGRDSWVTAKKAENIWKDVRAYDADSLEQWLDEAPAAHARITRMLGRDPEGAADLQSAWNEWAGRTIPPLPVGLATAGRDGVVKEVLAWLHGEPSAVSVSADSAEESFAFIAACLLELPEEERTALLARTLVVRTPEAWDEVLARAGASSSLVLIPAFPNRAGRGDGCRAPGGHSRRAQFRHRRPGDHASTAGHRAGPRGACHRRDCRAGRGQARACCAAQHADAAPSARCRRWRATPVGAAHERRLPRARRPGGRVARGERS